VTSLLTALSESFLQTTVRKVKKSPLYGLIIDLSTDRASCESMLVYVTFWDEGSMSAVTERGDNVMQGLRNGLAGRLRRHLHTFIGTHCAAHKQVLAVQSPREID
jgi:hypothetical protein